MQVKSKTASRYAYVKGQVVESSQAMVSIQERGFRFGDGVFETIRVSVGKPYQWDLHMERLQKGLSALKIKTDLSQLHQICNDLLLKNKQLECLLRLSISRGVGSQGYLPVIEGGATIVVEVIDLPDFNVSRSVDIWVGQREKFSNASIPGMIKTMQGLNSVLARIEAQEHQCFDALLCDQSGYVCEASSGNIFWVKDNQLFTPSIDLPMVAGTTRAAILRLAPCEVKTGKFFLEDIMDAQGAFITNVAWGVLSLCSLKPMEKVFDGHDLIGQCTKLLKEDIQRHEAC